MYAIFETMEIEIEGVKIGYSVTGPDDGGKALKTLLLLHGWGCDRHIFDCLLPELRRSMQVYALDFPGMGESGFPPTHFGVADYARLTAGFIRALGIEGTGVISHSFGGRVSIVLMSKYPGLVSKAVFTDAAGFRPRRGPRYYIRVYSYKAIKRLSKLAAFQKLCAALGVDIAARIKNAGSADYRALSDNMKRVFSNVVNQDLSGFLHGITAPVLLIYGENDADTPPEFGRRMERAIPDAGLVVLKGAGHYSFLDQTARYLKIVKNFFGV